MEIPNLIEIPYSELMKCETAEEIQELERKYAKRNVED